MRVQLRDSYSTYGFVQCLRIAQRNPHGLFVHVLAVNLLLLFTIIEIRSVLGIQVIETTNDIHIPCYNETNTNITPCVTYDFDGQFDTVHDYSDANVPRLVLDVVQKHFFFSIQCIGDNLS